jgi:hypothetical protein
VDTDAVGPRAAELCIVTDAATPQECVGAPRGAIPPPQKKLRLLLKFVCLYKGILIAYDYFIWFYDFLRVCKFALLVLRAVLRSWTLSACLVLFWGLVRNCTYGLRMIDCREMLLFWFYVFILIEFLKRVFWVRSLNVVAAYGLRYRGSALGLVRDSTPPPPATGSRNVPKMPGFGTDFSVIHIVTIDENITSDLFIIKNVLLKMHYTWDTCKVTANHLRSTCWNRDVVLRSSDAWHA